ncbi:MAG: hypothetical protein NT092_02875 [Bacteroidia bacterium]|nr:hypothetical protein [Bacteroidia bacterium]
MENLIFERKGWRWVKRIVGIFWILFGIFNLLFFYDKPLTLSNWIWSVACVLLGVTFFTPLGGYNETRFMVDDGNLKIKWKLKIGEITIRDNEIEKILLRNTKIEIQRKGKKPVVLLFDQWKLEDKTKVYEFMIEYARQKNLILEK